MISIILFFYNLIKKIPFLKPLFKNEIRRVLRLPPAKALRANILGISMGLFFIVLLTFFNYDAVYSNGNHVYLPWHIPFILTMLFMAGTYLIGGLFTLLAILGAIIFSVFGVDPAQGTFPYAVKTLITWNLIGYGFGVIFAILHNDLVYFYLLFGEKKYKIAFAYRPNKKINIIKSPYEREEEAILEKLKPLTYFSKQIEDSTTGRQSNADKITGLIKKAYEQMAGIEKIDLFRAMSLISDNSDFDEKLGVLNTKLAAAEPDTITKVEKEIAPLVDEKLESKKHKLYKFDLNEAPPAPYTILFVANPTVHCQPDKEENKSAENGEESINEKYKHDAIIYLPDLFYKSVDRALRSLESDEVVGSPEIWSRIRIVTIFNDAAKEIKKENYSELSDEALLEEFQYPGDYTIDGEAPENLLAPKQEMNSRVQKILEDEEYHVKIETNGKHDHDDITCLELKHVDVIFGLSANFTHDRSMAMFTNIREIDEEKFDEISNGPNGDIDITPVFPKKGVAFTFHPDPYMQKFSDDAKTERSINIENFSTDDDGKIISAHKHEFYATEPGRIALNIWGANQKTFIHEFAHAMTSVFNGVIKDEYADEFKLRAVEENTNGDKNQKAKFPFYINRIERLPQPDGKFIKVHKIFAKYNEVDFYSDLDHPTQRENWAGYFPERDSYGISCIMDRYTGLYRFNKLISNFMYDRLIAKLNRNLIEN